MKTLLRTTVALAGFMLLVPMAIGAADVWSLVMFQHATLWDWSLECAYGACALGVIGIFLEMFAWDPYL